MNLSDLMKDDKIKAIIFGPSKVGKTFGAMTFPRVNVLDFDNGIKTVIGRHFIEKYGVKKDLIYQSFKDLKRNPVGIVTDPLAFDMACKYFDDWMKPGKRDQFDTWVIDTGTTLSEMAQAKGVYLLGGKIKGAKSDTLEQGLKHGLVIPKLQDYGAERSMVEQFVSMVKDADKNLLFLCHEKEISNDAGLVTARVPLLTGKGVETVCLMFDDLWYLKSVPEGQEVKRKLITTTDTILKVGTRLGVPTGTEYSYPAIIKAVSENRALILKAISNAQGQPNASDPAKPR